MVVALFSCRQCLLECSCFSDTSDDYAFTSNAFIFSLRNNEGLGPFKSNLTKPSAAIYRHSSLGPTFGDGQDIYIADNANANSCYAYFGSAYSVPSGVQDKTR